MRFFGTVLVMLIATLPSNQDARCEGNGPPA